MVRRGVKMVCGVQLRLVSRRMRCNADRCSRGILYAIGSEHALLPKRIVLHRRDTNKPRGEVCSNLLLCAGGGREFVLKIFHTFSVRPAGRQTGRPRTQRMTDPLQYCCITHSPSFTSIMRQPRQTYTVNSPQNSSDSLSVEMRFIFSEPPPSSQCQGETHPIRPLRGQTRQSTA
jgi:hypothetical protein